MVRPRLQLERLNGELSREHYYLHNKSIVTKKVREMSVLTATDVLFLAFSPSGIPSLHLGLHSDFMNVVRRFAEVPYNDREKRRHDNLQTLRANYQKEGYNIEVQRLFLAWKVKKLETMREELDKLKEELAELNLRKSLWENPEKVNSIDKIKEMEESLKKSLDEIRKRKKQLKENEMSTPNKTPVQPTIEPFEEYIPEMLSGNDDLLAYANVLMSGNQASTSENQHK